MKYYSLSSLLRQGDYVIIPTKKYLYFREIEDERKR